MSESISIIRYQAPDCDASFVEFVGAIPDGAGTRWLLHLDPLAFLGSAAIGALVRWQRRLQERAGVVVLVQAGRGVLRVLRMLGLEDVLSVFETEEEATAKLGDPNGTDDVTVTVVPERSRDPAKRHRGR